MPIRAKKKTSTAADALLVGDVPETVDPGLAALLEDPVDTGRSSGLPKLNPKPPFLLRHWPMNWEIGEVDGSPTWLPRVEPHLLVRGAAGIRTPGPHEPESNAYADAVLEARRRGWGYLPLSTSIPDELLPPGVPAGRYRRRIRGQHPITRVDVEAWVSAWAIWSCSARTSVSTPIMNRSFSSCAARCASTLASETINFSTSTMSKA